VPARYHLLRVFTTADGSGGNELGVFVDGSEVPPAERQAVAAGLGYAETVFVDDAATGALRIFTPEVEFRLAGHPLIGTSWLLRRILGRVEVLRPTAGEIPTWDEDGLTWIRGNPDDGPEFEYVQLDSPADVDAVDPGSFSRSTTTWAWADERRGVVRSRVFLPDAGVPEDEATGASALRLARALGRPVQISQGVGSELFARPAGDGLAEVGGRVELEGVREL